MTPVQPVPTDQPSPYARAFQLHVEPDGRLAVITPDGVAVSEEPLPPIEPDALDRIPGLTDATIEVEGYWE